MGDSPKIKLTIPTAEGANRGSSRSPTPSPTQKRKNIFSNLLPQIPGASTGSATDSGKTPRMDVAKGKKRNILMLNDDCLCLIFSHFSILEVIHQLEKVCLRFQDVAQNIYKTYYELDSDKLSKELPGELFIRHFRDIANRVQPYVTTLKVNLRHFDHGSPDAPIMAVVCTFKHLEHLELHNIKCVMKNVEILTDIFKNLKTANLSNCRLTDRIGVCLEGATKLVALDVSTNFCLKGGFLKKLKNVEKLSLENCSNLKPHYFIDFCQQYRKLKSLNMRGCSSLDQSCMDALDIWQRNLQEMEIWSMEKVQNYELISNLPNLTHLTVVSRDMLKPNIVRTLVARDKLLFFRCLLWPLPAESLALITAFTKLKVFTLVDDNMNDQFLSRLACHKSLREVQIGSENITDAGILTLLDLCPNLEYLNIKQCKNLKRKDLNTKSSTCFVDYGSTWHDFRYEFKLQD